ncbi:MAG: alpha-L-rhamnosidase C-terminal domain-containing protein, partial [Oscillospiraceae bacterium]
RVLKKEELAQEYECRAEKTLAAIRKEFYTPGGRCAAATQTGQAMSLHFNLAPEEFRGKITKQLQKLLRDNDMHLKTGFLGTPILCRALSDNGAAEDAYTLFLKEDLPSWLYEVNMGATTIWERWNSILPNGKISGIGMNSMNHYAYGAVVEWMYRNVCGLNPCEDAPGFKKIVLRPQPDRRLGKAFAKVDTAAGRVESGWEFKGDFVEYRFVVPFDTVAELWISTKELKNCMMNGEKLSIGNDRIHSMLPAGNYHFC